MEKNEKLTEEEKAKLGFVAALAGMTIKEAGYPALIAIGFPHGMLTMPVGDPEELAFGKAHLGFKVLVGLVSAFDALTPEEQNQITKIASDAMTRKNAAREAAEAGEAAGETSDSAAVEETSTGEEAQHG